MATCSPSIKVVARGLLSLPDILFHPLDVFRDDLPSQIRVFFIRRRDNCPSADGDSFWIQIDDEDFVAANGLGTNGWEWVKLTAMKLAPGKHTLTIKYRENGALLDRIGITTYPFGPEGFEASEVWSEALRPILGQVLGAPAEVDHAPPPTGNPGL